MFLLCNFKGPDLGLGKRMRAFLRRVELWRGTRVVSLNEDRDVGMLLVPLEGNFGPDW